MVPEPEPHRALLLQASREPGQSEALKGAIAVGLAGLLAMPLAIATVGGIGTAAAMPAACAGASGPVLDLDPEQSANARIVVAVGQWFAVGEHGLVVGLAAAAQESLLYNLDYGDRTSLGLFQQQDWWGTPAERQDPLVAAEMFYSGGRIVPGFPGDGEEPGLLDIPGWQLMTVAQAAQAVQRSAFPDAYAKWEDDARAWLAVILGDPSLEPSASPTGSEPPAMAPPITGAGPPGPGDALVGCTADGQPIVDDLGELRARAQAFVDTSAAGLPDPFYGEYSYYRMCARLAARIHGHAHSGWPSAIDQWEHYVDVGLAHPGDGDPPPGALVFWDTDPFGHVAVYLGDGMVVTSDIYDRVTGRKGGVYLAPMSDVTSDFWHLPYLGWAPPVYGVQ